MAAGLFKRRSTATSSNLQRLSKTESELAQSSFNIEKITDIQNRFTGGEILLVPGRLFVREGVLWKVCRKGPKKRQFFLFNDVLIYGSILSRGFYSNQHILPINSMSVSSECRYMPIVQIEANETEDNPELKPENAFQINHADKSFHVYALSKADKVNWMSNLTKQINKFSKEGDGNTTQVLYKAVWVPDSASKQCMICSQKFNAFIRKHHCRMCGRVICSQCSPDKGDIGKMSGTAPTGKLERVCKQCKKLIVITKVEEMKDPVITPESPANNDKEEKEEEPEDGDESTETEDSDDSEIEEIPVAPPRRKKMAKLNASNESPAKVPPPRPAPPTRPPAPSRPPAPPKRPPSITDKSPSSPSNSLSSKGSTSSLTKTDFHTDIEPRPVPSPRQNLSIKKESDDKEVEQPRPVATKRTKINKETDSPVQSEENHLQLADNEEKEESVPPTNITQSINEAPPIEIIDEIPPIEIIDETPPIEVINETPPIEVINETPPIEVINEIQLIPIDEPDLTPPTNGNPPGDVTPPTTERNQVLLPQRKKKIINESSEVTSSPNISQTTGESKSPSINVRPRKSKFTASNN